MDTPDLEVVPFFTSEKIISPVVTFIALTVTVTEADDFFRLTGPNFIPPDFL